MADLDGLALARSHSSASILASPGCQRQQCHSMLAGDGVRPCLPRYFPKGLGRSHLPHVFLGSGRDGKSRTGAVRYSPAIAALQSELRILAASRRRALPAIQFAQRLMLGLRCVRSAYQARLSAWLHLASTALSDPTRPGEEDEASQEVINPPSRDLQRWLASRTGNAFVREIRWALLPCEVAVRRLRAVAPCQRLRDQALAHALLDSGASPGTLTGARRGQPGRRQSMPLQ